MRNISAAVAGAEWGAAQQQPGTPATNTATGRASPPAYFQIACNTRAITSPSRISVAAQTKAELKFAI